MFQAIENISAFANVKFKWTNQSCLPSKISQWPDIQWCNRDINNHFYEGTLMQVHYGNGTLM